MNEILTFDFSGDTLLTVRSDGGVFVAVKPICDAVGLAWNGQLERLKRDAVLAEGMRIIRIPSQGGRQETVCLPLELMHGWFFTIEDSRIKNPEARARVLLYKRECYAALHGYFAGRRGGASRRDPDRLADRFLLSRPMPPLLTRSRANRIRHYRAMHDQAVAALIHLGDAIGEDMGGTPEEDEDDASDRDGWA